jgi:dipeptidyl-peptidase-4
MKPLTIFSLLTGLLLSAACAAPLVVPATPASKPAPATAAGRGSAPLTARQLTAPGALAGPNPSGFNWSPVGAVLAYVEPQDGADMLWLYDAASGEKRLLLDPAGSAGNIDVPSAQWSPDGNRLLLTGDEAFWLLDVATGELTSLAAGGGNATSVVFTPDGTRVSYVQDNDLYVLDIDSGDVQRLTSDGGETVFNGALEENDKLFNFVPLPNLSHSFRGDGLVAALSASADYLSDCLE